MLRIYRIDHISQAVPTLEPQVALMENLFGFRRLRTWDNPAEGCRGARLAVPGSWNQHWELLAPSGENSPIGAFLEAQGGRPGLHHVAAEVPDLEDALATLKGVGIEPTASVPGRWVEASLSPPERGPGVRFRLRGVGSIAMCGDEPGVSLDAVASPEGGPTLGIVAVDHVCQAFPDRDELANWYRDLAGFVQVWRTADDEIPDMVDLVLNIPGSSICWEVISPRGEDSFVEKFWNRSGAAAHHVTFEVADWDRAMEACRHHEIPTFDDEEGVTDGGAWRHTFVHPKHTGGILVQLFWEELPGIWCRSDKIPPR